MCSDRSEPPMEIAEDRTLRVKIIDRCGLACTFCHNEGTPVTADNREAAAGELISGGGRTGRVSIYTPGNGANFLAAPVRPDAGFRQAVTCLRDALGLTELHLTGGEPTLHPKLAELIGAATEAGFSVRMTSNGENGARMLPACARAGLEKVNFSVFGTTAAELAEVQGNKYASDSLASRKVHALRRSIDTAARHKVGMNANIVVPSYAHAPRVHRLLDEYSSKLEVRLLNSLHDEPESTRAIHHILDELRARPVRQRLVAGASGYRTEYELPGGRLLAVKRIRDLRLPRTCRDCRFNNGRDCEEGYYGLRLYRTTEGQHMVGVCIQRMDLCLPLDEFLRSDLRDEVLRLRERDYADLCRSARHRDAES